MDLTFATNTMAQCSSAIGRIGEDLFDVLVELFGSANQAMCHNAVVCIARRDCRC
jgi:hypothetical protein